jgi:2-polyprenyl-6-methoxyphenol hydroxylase-like FAD-dependent oxidoreductase
MTPFRGLGANMALRDAAELRRALVKVAQGEVWPQIKGDKYIDRLNGLKKLVVSRTLKEVAWNASLLDLELAGTYQFKNGVVALKYFPR